jgi:uncharacterized protein
LSAAVSETLPPSFEPWLAERCPDVPVRGALAAIDLLGAGASVPFVARYRRDRTGGLDAAAVRRALEAKEAFEKVLSRQAIILESIERHATLDPALRERILSTFDPDVLEDLYQPYRQKKANRALAAREAGLQPLADWIWGCGHGEETPQEGQTLELWAFTFRNEEKGVKDAKAAIEGARDILVERLAGDAALRALARRAYFEGGWLRAAKSPKAKPQSRYEAYFAFQEKVSSLREPAGSHRYLAVRRGQADDELTVSLGGAPGDAEFEARLVAAFEEAACTVPGSPGAEVLRHAGRIAFKNDVRTAIENEVHNVLKDAADAAAAHAFAEGVRRRLLEPPFGRRAVLGVDPSLREGCRLAAVDGGGRPLATETVHLQADEQKAAAREAVVRLVREHALEAVAVGSGAGGREAEVLARGALREFALAVPVVLVSEAGAGAWSASEAAQAELPGLAPPDRAAVSIARRLQDPRAELVKLEPRGIGMGPHPHDVPHAVLHKALQAVVEDCVHGPGVDLNSAPRALLARVSGLSPALAAAVVERREAHGPFRSRAGLRDVPGVTPAAFEQAAGFLRVRDGDDPLDLTGVHPEQQGALEALAERLGKSVADLMGAGASLVRESPEAREALGELAWPAVVAELEAAGRDPRGSFVPFAFREDVHKLEDLQPGMACPGIVSHVASFGVFVDMGVRHDGLVHISQLGPRHGARPLEAGDRVVVRVLKVDLAKKQISLTTRTPPQERRPPRGAEARARRASGGDKAPPRSPSARRPARPSRPAAPASPPAADGPATPPAPAAARPAPRPPGPRPSGPRPSGPRPRPAAAPRPESRRPAFNNPFAVLAGLKVPPKKS